MSQLTVPRASGRSLPYDDAGLPARDVRRLRGRRQNLSILRRPVAQRRPAPPTLEVPVETALMASALHLHLD